MTALDPMQPPAELAPDVTVTPTPTEARQDVRDRVLDVILAHASTNAAYPISPRDLDAGRARAVALADAVIAAAVSPAVSAPDLDAMSERRLRFAQECADPDFSLSIPWPAKEIISELLAEVTRLDAALAAAHAETRGETDRANQWERAQAETVAEWEADSARLTAERDEARAALARVEGLASRWDTLSGDMLRAALAAAPSETEEGR